MVYDLYIYPNTLMTWFFTFVKHWEGVSFVHVLFVLHFVIMSVGSRRLMDTGTRVLWDFER